MIGYFNYMSAEHSKTVVITANYDNTQTNTMNTTVSVHSLIDYSIWWLHILLVYDDYNI